MNSLFDGFQVVVVGDENMTLFEEFSYEFDENLDFIEDDN